VKANRIFLNVNYEKPIFYLANDMMSAGRGSRKMGYSVSRSELLRLKSGQSFTYGVFSEFCDVVNVEFFHDLTTICLNGFSAYMQL